jgi:hypothetical protein
MLNVLHALRQICPRLRLLVDSKVFYTRGRSRFVKFGAELHDKTCAEELTIDIEQLQRELLSRRRDADGAQNARDQAANTLGGLARR